MAQTLEDAGLAMEMAAAQLLAAPATARSGLGRRRNGCRARSRCRMGDATTALEELADLAELERRSRQDYPGARLDDVDEEAVRRALGRQAVDDLAALRRIEAELERQGYLEPQRRAARADAEGGAPAWRDGAAPGVRLARRRRRGDHDQVDAGQAGELTGSSRAWQFGDEQPIDVVRTVRNAVRRRPPVSGSPRTRCRRRLRGGRRPNAAPPRRYACWSTCRTRWRCAAPGASAKQTALALHALVATRYPAGRHPDRRLLQLRARVAPDRAGRPRLGHGAGHQPAPRTADRRAASGRAPRARADRPDRHRRRADRTPAARRALLVRLAAVAGDARTHAGRGGQDDRRRRR